MGLVQWLLGAFPTTVRKLEGLVGVLCPNPGSEQGILVPQRLKRTFVTRRQTISSSVMPAPAAGAKMGAQNGLSSQSGIPSSAGGAVQGIFLGPPSTEKAQLVRHESCARTVDLDYSDFDLL